MTQQEFQERTGFDSHITYELANAAYMALDMDKDAFCDDYKDHWNSVIIANLFKKVEELQMKMDAIRRQRAETVEFLLQQEHETDDQTFRDKAVELVGEKEVIRLKIENGWDFCDADKEYIKEHIQ